jgi:hypothetical protein
MSIIITAIVSFYKMEAFLFNVTCHSIFVRNQSKKGKKKKRKKAGNKERKEDRKKIISLIAFFNRNFREPILNIFFSCDGDFSVH